MQSNQRKLGIALVGLGEYSDGQLAPALKQTKHCYLAGIVTGTPQKAEEWKRKYKIPPKNVYTYESFDSIRDNEEIDIVYIVLPNSMHASFTIRAAQAGKHVICEKPMGISVKECEDMITACKQSNRLLSIGYRLHFEPYNQFISDFGQKRTSGKILKITTQHSREVEPNVWRINKKLAGGGPLMDVGIYCVQAAIYTLGQNPIAVTAQEGKKTDLQKFATVEQSLIWQMEFQDGVVAHCETSYAEEKDLLRADAEHGYCELSPVYAYAALKGNTHKGEITLPEVNQQALQMDDFAICVLDQKQTKVPGEMGLRDVKILLAIYEAAKSGKRIALNF